MKPGRSARKFVQSFSKISATLRWHGPRSAMSAAPQRTSTTGSSRIEVPIGPALWICGDCHIGNLGPVADKIGRVAMQVRDLDQTVIGNPAHDLIRLGPVAGDGGPGLECAGPDDRPDDGAAGAGLSRSPAGGARQKKRRTTRRLSTASCTLRCAAAGRTSRRSGSTIRVHSFPGVPGSGTSVRPSEASLRPSSSARISGV
jgi:hypothetical protein